MQLKLKTITQAPSSSTLEHTRELAIIIGTRTYSNFDYVLSLLDGPTHKEYYYVCDNMHEEFVNRLKMLGINSFIVHTHSINDDNLTSLSHPTVIVQDQESYYLFDLTYGIFNGIDIDLSGSDGVWSVTKLPRNRYRLSHPSLKNSLRFYFDPDNGSQDIDHAFFRSNNFPYDQNTITYRRNASGSKIAGITFLHGDILGQGLNSIAIHFKNEDNEHIEYRYRYDQIQTDSEQRAHYCKKMDDVCLLLGLNPILIREQLDFLMKNVDRLRELQAAEGALEKLPTNFWASSH